MNDKLRQSAEPFERPPLAHLPPLPSRMFTYHTVDLPVKQARISSERRKRLGPWVCQFPLVCFVLLNYSPGKGIEEDIRSCKL